MSQFTGLVLELNTVYLVDYALFTSTHSKTEYPRVQYD